MTDAELAELQALLEEGQRTSGGLSSIDWLRKVIVWLLTAEVARAKDDQALRARYAATPGLATLEAMKAMQEANARR